MMMDKSSAGLIGLIIGLMLGYICGRLQNNGRVMKQEHAETPAVPAKGLGRFRLINRFGSGQIMLFMILALTVFSTIIVGNSSNKVENQQKSNDKQLACTSDILDRTIDAINSRTAFNIPLNQASAELQDAQKTFFASINPSSPTIVSDYAKAYAAYEEAYNKYAAISAKSKSQIVANNYPSPDELTKCVNGD